MSLIKSMFGKRPTTKGDVIVAVGAAIIAVFKAVDVHREYKAEQADNQIKEIEQ